MQWSRGLIGCLLVMACGEEADDMVSRADSSGVEIVTVNATDTPLPWEFVEQFRLGGADSGAGSFTSVSPMTVRTSGNRIVVFDPDRARFEIFDASGALLSEFGRKGSGPGEIGFSITQLDLGAGQVGVFDFSKLAIVRFGDHRRLRSHRGLSWVGEWSRVATRLAG